MISKEKENPQKKSLINTTTNNNVESEKKKEHDIKKYIEEIHGKKREVIDPVLQKAQLIKKLRKLLKIL